MAMAPATLTRFPKLVPKSGIYLSSEGTSHTQLDGGTGG